MNDSRLPGAGTPKAARLFAQDLRKRTSRTGNNRGGVGVFIWQGRIRSIDRRMPVEATARPGAEQIDLRIDSACAPHGRFRVTMGLVKDHAEAEDLVQDTFRWRFSRSTGSGRARTRVRGCSRSFATQTRQQVIWPRSWRRSLRSCSRDSHAADVIPMSSKG